MINPLVAQAYAIKVGVQIGSQPEDKNYNYTTYIKDILNFGLKIGFVLVIAMIIYGGIKYILSQGNQSALGEAKDIITSSILGFLVLLLIQLLLYFLKT